MPAIRSVLFICLGNICRSPLAEGILRREAKARGIDLEIDSAGTGEWHAGELPDPRACAEGEARGCDMTMRARQIRMNDFERFDLIVAMDAVNLRDLLRLAGKHRDKVRLMRSFDPTAHAHAEVADPYCGTETHFTEVGDQLERAVRGLLDEIAASTA